jgi:hypothetical protein
VAGTSNSPVKEVERVSEPLRQVELVEVGRGEAPLVGDVVDTEGDLHDVTRGSALFLTGESARGLTEEHLYSPAQ